MNSTTPLKPYLSWKGHLKVIFKLSLLFLVVLSACSPTTLPAASVDVSPTLVEAVASPTIVPTVEATPLPTSTPEEELVYPLYLPLATKPAVEPQTINGVTAQIGWVYVDESRVSLQYTISGLDWPDGTTWDAMLLRITSPAIPDTAYNGGGGWSSTPVQGGVMTGTTDQFLMDGALDAGEHPSVKLRVSIPLEGPTPVGTFHLDVDVPVLGGIKMENVDQSVVANNVSMTLKTLILTPSYASTLLCFQMPSPVDWGLTATKITVGGREFPFSGAEIVSGTDGKGFLLTDPERCVSVGFNIPYDESASSITLTVPMLLGSIPEVVTAERVAMANQRLAAQGIQIDYVNVEHGGNLEILERPEGTTDMEIYPQVWTALSEQYEGPWVFTIAIER